MAKKAAAAAIDPRSARPVLFLVRRHGGLPKRDVSWADLNRLAYKRALRIDPRKRPPDLAGADALTGLADELVAGGFYARSAAPTPPPVDEPAPPAEEPEV